MEYKVVSIANNSRDIIEKLINNLLNEHSKELFDFTRKELDSIADYDVMRIMGFYYSKMNARQRSVICRSVEEVLELSDVEDTFEEFDEEEELYVPRICKLMDRLGDRRINTIFFESLFAFCQDIVEKEWDIKDSYSNYLVLLNAAYFCSIAHRLHVNTSYRNCLNEFFGESSYEDLVESLYEKHPDEDDWDVDVDLEALEEMIEESEADRSFVIGEKEEYFEANDQMNAIRRGHRQAAQDAEDKEGFALIQQKTGIREQKCTMIHGFECHFCEAKSGDDEYIIVYQKETRINEIIDNDAEWRKFQHDLYYEDIKHGQSNAMVYIVYILDGDSSNIPIQVIESNKTYGRKYVFTEEETITFINGIVKTSHDESGTVSPVQEWDRILREEHLTACLTEAYSAKKVEGYLAGQRFDADYSQDDDYAMLTKSDVPQIKWVKSLDTKGFRDFCFNDEVMEFGQINLFYGANGSGKTSVLEAIEYALTAEVRRIKDFKVKLPTDNFPKLSIYDREAGVHTFTPGFAKKNTKEIDRVWFGVPIGRTKTTLNDNFNRFNAFDSEAAYKFIHESDNSEDSYASMFGNLMFGESVVDHEKKWQRFKKAFNDRYSELRSELNEAREMAEYYESILAQKSDDSKSEDIEKGIVELKLLIRARLPKASSDRYPKILEELTMVRKYIDVLAANYEQDESFGEIASDIATTKKSNAQYTKEKREHSDEITQIAGQNGDLKKRIFEEKAKQSAVIEKIDDVNRDIRNWTIVQNVLSHEDTIRLVNSLIDEMTEIERELYFISKIEQRPAIVNFLKLDKYEAMADEDRSAKEKELIALKLKKSQIEKEYEEAKRAFGEKEQQAIELRRIGKTLLTDSKCPLCGHEFDSMQQLVEIIDNSVVVDDSIESLISEIQNISQQIIEIEKVLDREKLIQKATSELMGLSDTVPMIEECKGDYKRLGVYLESKTEKEKRKEEIIEQQAALDAQGFSVKNINACREYKTSDPSYLEYKKNGTGTYADYLNARLQRYQLEQAQIEANISSLEKEIQGNSQREELLRTDIHRLDALIDALDMENNREVEQALENIRTKFEVSDDIAFGAWESKYHSVFDKCEIEVERMESQDSIAFEKKCLADYKATVKRTEPMVERCAKAVQAFERMPSLSSFVEQGIKNNIQQISKFFKWMHHSGEFEELGIDSEGIYAIRGLNHQKIRTYEMSTGQRSTIAMAVMFALHMAAPDAPQFLLLDEPLATMDDTQVLNVLDILKSMAEQNTQIFFTTANGIMINLFKECFKNTDFDYKEYQFIKRVNRPSEIKPTSVNDAKTIEEITLKDLTLDFNQFAQIRAILRRNQEKLVSKDEWEILEGDGSETAESAGEEQISEDVGFLGKLSPDERKLLRILVDSAGDDQLRQNLSPYPTFKIMFENINDKAVDFFGETIVENDDELPWMEDYYRKEIETMFGK